MRDPGSKFGRGLDCQPLFREMSPRSSHGGTRLGLRQRWRPRPLSKESVSECWLIIISFPDLLWTKPKARSGQTRFALRDHLSGM